MLDEKNANSAKKEQLIKSAGEEKPAPKIQKTEPETLETPADEDAEGEEAEVSVPQDVSPKPKKSFMKRFFSVFHGSVKATNSLKSLDE